MAGRERAMAGSRRDTGAAGRAAGCEDAGWLRPGAGLAAEQRPQCGIHRRFRTAYPATRQGRERQPIAGVTLPQTARAVARATPTTPELISGYLGLSTLR